jgi:hypothetical protein
LFILSKKRVHFYKLRVSLWLCRYILNTFN